MNVFFRVDASVEIGTGHIMRCLTFADSLKENGVKSTFICRELEGNLNELIEKRKYKVCRLPVYGNSMQIFDQELDAQQTLSILGNEKTDVDWIIADHYLIDISWESHIRPFVKKIMIIDDLADRFHDCDILLDQNYFSNLERRYDGLVPSFCKKLLGPKFALLRPEFLKTREILKSRDGCIRRVLVFFGGSDPTHETEKVIEAFKKINRTDIIIDVVVGTANPNRVKIKELCRLHSNFNFYLQVENIAELMTQADLAIGSGGATTWERCFLGLPTITIIIAENQKETTNTLAENQAIWNLGWYHEVSVDVLVSAINKAIDNRDKIRNLGIQAYKVMNDFDAKNENPVIRSILGG